MLDRKHDFSSLLLRTLFNFLTSFRRAVSDHTFRLLARGGGDGVGGKEGGAKKMIIFVSRTGGSKKEGGKGEKLE